MQAQIIPRLEKKNLKEIMPIYRDIFNENLSDKQIKKVQEKGELTYHIFTYGDEEIGFAIIQKRKNSVCHLWLCGLKEKQRGHNLGRMLMEKIESFATNEYRAHDITMSTHNERREMLALAIKLGYRITDLGKTSYGDGVKIRLKKKLDAGREIRFILTNKCNLNCFFCHSEGSKPQKRTESARYDKISQFIYEAVENGFDDITLTGGEPFLCKETITDIINMLNKIEYPPLLTIVSNGLHIDRNICQILGTYKNKTDKMKVHLSLHSIDENIYREITGYKGSKSAVEKVFQAIELLKENNIKVKLNCVLLNSLNCDSKTIKDYLKKAHEAGVHTVKFLELMVIPQNHELFKYFIDYNACLEILKSIGGIEKHNKKRGSELEFRNFMGMKVEITKLTCKFGCGNCLKIRDRTFNPEGQLIPCFVEGNPIPRPTGNNNSKNINEMIESGDEFIQTMAARFPGKDSPILTKQIEYVNQRTFICFESAESNEKCRDFLLKKNATFHNKNSFTANYFLPKINSSEWSECQKTIWLRTKEINKSQLIITQNRYENKSGILLTMQNFLDNKPLELSSFREMEKILLTMDFVFWFKVELEISLFNIEGFGHLSLSQIEGKTCIQVNLNGSVSPQKCLDFFAPINARPIKIPLPQWIYEKQKPHLGSCFTTQFY